MATASGTPGCIMFGLTCNVSSSNYGDTHLNEDTLKYRNLSNHDNGHKINSTGSTICIKRCNHDNPTIGISLVHLHVLLLGRYCLVPWQRW